MSSVILGKSGIHSPKNGFGALPIQRVSKEYAAMLLRRLMMPALPFLIRHGLIPIAKKRSVMPYRMYGTKLPLQTKTGATDGKTFWEHLETSLKNLRTDYIDLYQFHTPFFLPQAGRWHRIV